MMEKEVIKQRLDVMLDMETCALSEDAAILSIALLPFYLDGGEPVEQPVYYIIEGNSCFLEGMKYDDDTQAWWRKQDPKAKASILFGKDPIHIREAIKNIYDYLSDLCEVNEVHMWCRGLNFDIPKLEYCFKKFLDKKPPYKYYNMEDARTYCHTFGVRSTDIPFVGCRHTAMDDCIFQVKQVQVAREVYEKIIACQKNVESKS